MFKLGDTFQFGLVKLKVVPNPEKNCIGCYLENFGCYGNMELCVGSCYAEKREDNANIKFVKICV